MSHAVIRIIRMRSTLVQDFYLSIPDDLKRLVLEKVLATGIDARVFAGNRVQFKDEEAGIELSVLCRWVESCGWKLFTSSDSTIATKNVPLSTLVFSSSC